MGKIGHVELKNIDMMDVIVLDDGEYTFHTALFDSRPPFVFRVPKYAHSASSHALRDGVINFKFIREATMTEIGQWLLSNKKTIVDVKTVRIPNRP